MLLINQVTDATTQRRNLVLEDGTSLDLEVQFVPLQGGWFINELSYLGFTLRGVRIGNNLNILNQYRNLLPFGLACVTDLEREPSLQGDFLSGEFKLFILTAEEVQQFSEFLSAEV